MNICLDKNSFGPIIFGLKIFWTKFCSTQNFFGPKISSGPKLSQTQHFFELMFLEHIFLAKFFVPRNFWTQNFLDPTFFGTISFDQKLFHDENFYFDNLFFTTKNLLRTKIDFDIFCNNHFVLDELTNFPPFMNLI